MDALSALLDSHRGRGADVLRCAMAAPWGIRVDDGAALTLLLVLRGELRTRRDDETPRLVPGDCLLLPGPTPYDVTDAAGSAPSVVVRAGLQCEDLDGAPVRDAMGFGIRTWGNAEDGECAFLVGTWQLPHQLRGGLLERLPTSLRVAAAEESQALTTLVTVELACDRPGQDAVLDRLLDLLLVSTLRRWCETAGDAAPAGWQVLDDRHVADALRLLHDRPGDPWSAESLAERVGLSRSHLNARFTELVGHAPMTYLADWRMTVAAERLLTTKDTLEAIATDIGYSSPFSFSAAFKRHTGMSPRDYRQQHREA